MHYIVGSDGSTASRARETRGRTEDAQGTESLTEEATGTTETGAIYRENTLDCSYPHLQFTYMYTFFLSVCMLLLNCMNILLTMIAMTNVVCVWHIR